MIDFTVIRSDVEKHLQDNFTLVPIVFENDEVTEENHEECISLFDTLTDSIPGGISDPSYVCRGLLIVKIFTALGIGTHRSKEIGSNLSNLLSGKSVGSATFAEAELHSIPSDKESIFFEQKLLIPYVFVYGGSVSEC